ncbi:MAG: hypothetical protein ACOX4W_05970 [Bacilli bacterium]|jgi:hypothetical protein
MADKLFIAKTKAIEKTLAFCSQILKMSPIKLKFLIFEDSSNVFAAFDASKNRILIDSAWAKDATIIEIIVAVAHEMRHAYQLKQINLLNKNKKTTEPKNVVMEWHNDFENYVFPKTDSLDAQYIKSSIEIDALAFSYYFVKKLYNYETAIPEIIKESVFFQVKVLESKKLI